MNIHSRSIKSYINIISGIILIIGLVGCNTTQGSVNGTSETNLTITADKSDQVGSPKLVPTTLAPTIEVDRNISVSSRPTNTTAEHNESESAMSENDPEEDDNNKSESEGSDANNEEREDSSGDDSKLMTTLVEVANEASDKIVDKLKGTESPSEEETSEESDVEATTLASTVVDKRKHSKEVNEAQANYKEIEELKFAMNTYTHWRGVADEMIELFSRKFLPVIMEHGYDVDSNTVSGLLQVFNGIRGIKPWALKLLDASGKLSPGILLGTQSDFGDYDECLNVRSDDPSGLADSSLTSEIDPETGLKTSTLVGRYCLADVEFPKPPRSAAPIELRKPLYNFSESAAFKDTIFVETGNFFHMLYVDPIRVGICLTNKIDPDNFAKVFNKILQEFQVSINFHGRCATKYDKHSWTSYQSNSAKIVVVSLVIVALSTILDILHMKLNKVPIPKRWQKLRLLQHNILLSYRPLFTSFSVIRNTRRLFKSQQRKHDNHNHKKHSSFVESGKIQHYKDNLISSSSSSSASLVVKSTRAEECMSSVLNATQEPQNSSTSSSLESSPSIERRSSTGSSGCQLISEPSLSLINAMNVANKSTSNACYIESGKLDGHRDVIINLNPLHGIRVITMAWMIVNHTYMFGGFFVLWAHRRLIDIAEWPKSVSFQFVLNGWLTVETYFFLSAMIIVLNVLPLMKAHKFTYLGYIIHRLFRIIPAYVGLVCFNFLWPIISSGPVWMVKGKSFIEMPCENYLWTNFLFINNWIWPEKQCMVHTWFLSADFQLYLLAPIVVYLFYRRPVLGHTLNISCAIVASIISGLVIYANNLLPATLINKLEFDSIKQQLSYAYFATYQHMGPYSLGLFIGYILHKRPSIKLPTHLTWLLWILLPPLSFTTLLLTYLWNGAYDVPTMINPSPLESAFYVAIHRTIWSSLLAWLVFACATGRATLLTGFLSHPMFVPLSRLSFSIYLVHFPVIMYRALNIRHTLEWTDSNILWESSGNFVASALAAYILNIVFESPWVNLEQLIFKRPKLSTGSISSGVSSTNGDHVNIGPARNVLRPQTESQKSNSTYEPSDRESKSDETGSTSSVNSQDNQTNLMKDRANDHINSRIESYDTQMEQNRLRQPKRMLLTRGLSLREEQGEQNDMREDMDNIHQHTLNRINRFSRHQMPRATLLENSKRPQQYATIARTERLGDRYPSPTTILGNRSHIYRLNLSNRRGNGSIGAGWTGQFRVNENVSEN